MENTLLHLDSFNSQFKPLTKDAETLLSSFLHKDMTVGEIDWVLSRAKELLAHSTFRGISLPIKSSVTSEQCDAYWKDDPFTSKLNQEN